MWDIRSGVVDGGLFLGCEDCGERLETGERIQMSRTVALPDLLHKSASDTYIKCGVYDI